MIAALVLLGLWLILHGHLWLALVEVVLAGLASVLWEAHRAPVIPEMDEDLQAAREAYALRASDELSADLRLAYERSRRNNPSARP